jgi:toxin ParE1/3/4
MTTGLRWADEAVADLGNITNYLFQTSPDRAAVLVRGIYNAPQVLLAFPKRGRPGRKEGTRELLLLPLPWVVIYRIVGETIYVVRILHGAQQWP